MGGLCQWGDCDLEQRVAPPPLPPADVRVREHRGQRVLQAKEGRLDSAPCAATDVDGVAVRVYLVGMAVDVAGVEGEERADRGEGRGHRVHHGKGHVHEALQ
eukprot:scaffold90212_cov43-Phaeocystis_antarctica.AAC.1